MPFYENTIVAKQDLAEKEIKVLREKYKELIKVFIFIINLKEIKKH